jgi:hypothetical protein
MILKDIFQDYELRWQKFNYFSVQDRILNIVNKNEEDQSYIIMLDIIL